MGPSNAESQSTLQFPKPEQRNLQFVYPEGDLEDGGIRLIRIQPGSRNEPLSCDLETIGRDGKVSYAALSYVWGDPTVTERISVNEKDCWIPINLRDALIRIRERQWTFWIWIDAICINQADTAERNAQVQRMGEIYSQADEVIIWLGDAVDGSSTLEDVCHLGNIGEHCTKEDVLEKESSLRDMLSRPWFSRLWVLQEAALAKQAKVLLGAQTCALDSLLLLGPMLQTIVDALKQQLQRQSVPFSERRFIQNNCQMLTELKLLRTAIDCKPTMRPLSYREIVNRARRLTCHDPRDHIFGLTGIAKSLGICTIEINYNKSTAQIYQQFMQQELLRKPGTIIFDKTCDVEHNPPDLPSWVENFSRFPEVHRFHLAAYRAGGKNSSLRFLMDSFSPDCTTLALSGYRFDITGALGRPYEGALHEWVSAHEKYFLENYSGPNPYGGYTERYGAWWRTLCGNKYAKFSWAKTRWVSEKILRSANGDAYELLMKRAMPIPDRINLLEHDAIVMSASTLAYGVRWTIKERRILLTRTGYLCIGPKQTNIDDLVVVITGLSMPLIIRKRPNRTTYQMIGPAYVHGIST